MTDLFPGLRRMQSVLPEHGCLLVSPGNYWQNQRELFDSDPDLLKTIQKHEPKGLHTSATLRGTAEAREAVNGEGADEESYERTRHQRRFGIRRGWGISIIRELSCFPGLREQAVSFRGGVLECFLSGVAH